jgi:hypothetical protein
VSAQTQVYEILNGCGAVLVRRRKHKVYKFPNGKTFVVANTPSDIHAASNQLTDLRRTIGMTPKHKEGTRRRPRILKSAAKEKMIPLPELNAPPLADFKAALAAIRRYLIFYE